MGVAPELLRSYVPMPQGSQSGDVFSFAMILYVLIFDKDPYHGEDYQGLKHQLNIRVLVRLYKSFEQSVTHFNEEAHNFVRVLCTKLSTLCLPDIVMRVRNKAELIPCRPRVFEVPGNLYGFVQLMRECWEEDPGRRPSAARVRSRLRELSGGK